MAADTVHTEAQFKDDDAARRYLESIHWPNGSVCPHCGSSEHNSRLSGKGHRPGLLFRGDCREQFTVIVSTVMEGSKVSLHTYRRIGEGQEANA